MFCNFCAKIRKFKMAAIFGKTNFFENWHGYSGEIPCGSKISSKSLYLARFSRYKHFCVLQFCEKFENSKWPPFFARNFLFENWHGYSAEIPCGSKISSKWPPFLARQNFFGNWHGYSADTLWVKNFVENSKLPPFLARQKFFEKREKYSAETSCGSKILSKSLYLARFSRYKHFCVFLIWKIRND